MVSFPKFLIEGHQNFRLEKYEQDPKTYEMLATKGQKPRVLLVGCSDSRVDPFLIFGAEPGDLFVVRNVANLVPPYETGGSFHGVSAALEFGIMHLEVEHVVVLGHTGCGGVKAMLDPKAEFRSDMMFISNWVQMMAEQRDQVLHDMPHACMEDKMEVLEQLSIKASLENLRTFPFVSRKESAGSLQLHGAYFDVGSGSLFALEHEDGQFRKV